MTEEGIVILVKFWQLLKTLSPIVVTEEGISSVSNCAHSKKAKLLIDESDDGKVTFLSEMHFSNIRSPIDWTESGISIWARRVQPLNALDSIVVTEGGMTTFVTEESRNALSLMTFIVVGIVISLRPKQFANTFLPNSMLSCCNKRSAIS